MSGLSKCRNRWNLKLCYIMVVPETNKQMLLHAHLDTPKEFAPNSHQGFQCFFLCAFFSSLHWPHKEKAFVSPVSNHFCYWTVTEWLWGAGVRPTTQGAMRSLFFCHGRPICPSSTSPGGHCHFSELCSAPWTATVSSAGSMPWWHLCNVRKIHLFLPVLWQCLCGNILVCAELRGKGQSLLPAVCRKVTNSNCPAVSNWLIRGLSWCAHSRVNCKASAD